MCTSFKTTTTKKKFVFIAEFGVFLAEITVEPSGPLAIRQLASVLLKQYVHSHWSEHSDKFRVPETTEAVSKVVKLKFKTMVALTGNCLLLVELSID